MVLATVLVGVAGAAGTATQIGEEPSLVVTLDADGSAEVALTLTYDLETDSEREAFRELQDNETARERARERFRTRMAAVASDAATETGREMSVSDPRIDLSTTDDGTVGIVVFRLEYDALALARADGDELVVTEPFASGYQPDRTVVFRAPDGYRLADAAPAPDDEAGASISYEASATLDGFEATFEAADTEADGGEDGDGDEATDAGGPGFGVLAALAALAAALLARRVTR